VPLELAPGQMGTETLDVVFNPTAVQSYNGNIVLTDNDTNAADSSVAITGSGTSSTANQDGRLGDLFAIDGTEPGVTPSVVSRSYDSIDGINNDLYGIIVHTQYTNPNPGTLDVAAETELEGYVAGHQSNVYIELSYGPIQALENLSLGISYGGDTILNTGTAHDGQVQFAYIQDTTSNNNVGAIELNGSTQDMVSVNDYNIATDTQQHEVLIRADQLTAAGIALLDNHLNAIEHIFVTIAPIASLSVPSLNFGDEALGQSKTMQVTVSNNGTGNLDITGVTAPAGYTVVPDGSAGFGSGVNIAAGASQLFDVTFAPGATGSYNGNLVFTDDDTTLADSTLALTGASDFVTVVGAGIPAQTVAENAPLDILAAQYFNEPVAGDSLTFSLQGQPSWMHINSATGEITGTPGALDVGVPESATVIATNAAGDMVQSTFNVTIQPPVLNRLGDVFTIDGTVSGVSPALASESYDAIVGNTTNDLAGIMVQTLSTNTSGVAPTGAALSALDSEISSGNSNLYFELNFGPVGSGVDKFLNLQYGNVTAGGADITAGTPTAGAVYAAQILGEVEKSFSTTNLTTASELTGATASNLLVQDYNNTVNFPNFTYDDVFLIRADRLTAAGITLLEANTGVIEHVFNVVDPAASSSVPSLSFGNEAVGVPETLHVTITNNGTANLDITGFSAPAGYTVVPDGSSGFGSGVNIAVGGHQLFDVTFTPGATGTDNGNLVFTDNDPILADSTIALTGESDVVTLVGAGIPTQNATLGQPVDIKTAQYFSEPVAGDNLTYSFQGQHSGLQINPSTGEITGTGNFLTSESITVNATNQFGSQVQSTFELNVQGVDMRLGDAFSADGTVSGVVPAIAPETYDAAVGNTTNSLGGIIVQTVYSNTTGATPAASDVAILDS